MRTYLSPWMLEEIRGKPLACKHALQILEIYHNGCTMRVHDGAVEVDAKLTSALLDSFSEQRIGKSIMELRGCIIHAVRYAMCKDYVLCEPHYWMRLIEAQVVGSSSGMTTSVLDISDVNEVLRHVPAASLETDSQLLVSFCGDSQQTQLMKSTHDILPSVIPSAKTLSTIEQQSYQNQSCNIWTCGGAKELKTYPFPKWTISDCNVPSDQLKVLNDIPGWDEWPNHNYRTVGFSILEPTLCSTNNVHCSLTSGGKKDNEACGNKNTAIAPEFSEIHQQEWTASMCISDSMSDLSNDEESTKLYEEFQDNLIIDSKRAMFNTTDDLDVGGSSSSVDISTDEEVGSNILSSSPANSMLITQENPCRPIETSGIKEFIYSSGHKFSSGFHDDANQTDLTNSFSVGFCDEPTEKDLNSSENEDLVTKTPLSFNSNCNFPSVLQKLQETSCDGNISSPMISVCEDSHVMSRQSSEYFSTCLGSKTGILKERRRKLIALAQVSKP